MSISQANKIHRDWCLLPVLSLLSLSLSLLFFICFLRHLFLYFKVNLYFKIEPVFFAEIEHVRH